MHPGRMLTTSWLFLAAWVASAQARHPVRSTGAEMRAALPDTGIRPLVDHHQHLLSPQGQDLLYANAMPALSVPAEVAALLAERARRWNDSTALAELYTEGSSFFESSQDGIDAAEGRLPVASHASQVFGRPFRITPYAYQLRDSVARVAALFTRGAGRHSRNFGHAYFELRRGSAREWRIATESLSFPVPPAEPTIDAAQLIARLDSAGIQRAVVLSDAYWFDAAVQPNTDSSYAEVRAENDWTAAQVARSPQRLVAFCSFNPLREHALAELRRCAASGRFRGVKLHFGSSRVHLLEPSEVAAVRLVFQQANALCLPLVVHVRIGTDREYGRADANAFLEQLLPAAPDVPVQVAHLWGGEAYAPEALAAFAAAVAERRPATRHLYFDVADVAPVAGNSAARLREIASRMREIGMERLLYGSDAIGTYHPGPRGAWEEFRTSLPLTRAEFATIAGNVAPYLRPRGQRSGRGAAGRCGY